jgi:tetratricopeptide (TPR) repeat protein
MSRGKCYEGRGEYGRAVRSYRAALGAARSTSGPDDGATSREAECLVRLGRVVRLAGRYRWAESLLVRATELVEDQASDHDGPALAAMNELAVLYKYTARFDEAEALYHRGLAMLASRHAGDSHDLATLYHNLGGLEHARRAPSATRPRGGHARAAGGAGS